MDSNVFLYLMMAVGVVVSVVLPLIRPFVPKPPGFDRTGWEKFWKFARPYLATAVFSLILALLVLAALQETITDWRTAFLAGYTADSTLQKITTGNQTSG